MGGVSILFAGGHLEVEISSCCHSGVYFLGGIVFYMGYTVNFGGVAIFSRCMATFHIGIVYLLVKDV